MAMASSMKVVGFVGLGTMGLPMASNLARSLPADEKLYAYDILKENLQKLKDSDVEAKVVMCKSAAEVISNADVLITIVPEGAHVRSVYLNKSAGVISGDLKNKILIDCSTIDIETSSSVSKELKQREPTVSFYDAPVSGGSLGAENGSLTFMVGSSTTEANWTVLEGLLRTMGKTVVPCGGLTLGLVAKLSNNYCSALIALATAEAMNLGMRCGMNPRTLAEVFRSSTAQSTICDKWCPVPGVVPNAPSSNGYQGGFKVQLMKKDVALALEAAKEVQAETRLGSTGFEVYSETSDDPNCRDLDSRVVFRYIGGNEDWA